MPPNTTYYGTECIPANSDIGSCFDIRDRVASFESPLKAVGWERTKVVWTVPPGRPTGEE